MKNLFLSPKGTSDFQKIISIKLETIQSEQRHARQDLVIIQSMIHKLIVDKHLQAQAEEYFDEDKTPGVPKDESMSL